MTEIERLAGTDLSMLWPDDLGWPQDIGGLAIVERRHLVDAEGELRLDELRSCIEAKLPAMRHFRQVLRRPGFGCGRPFWVDDARFSIDRHVRQIKIPEPATESQLVKSCEMLRRRRFDTSRPLWEIWFVTGLEADRMGIFVKVHHALADGAAGVAALAPDEHPVHWELSVRGWLGWIVVERQGKDQLRQEVAEYLKTHQILAPVLDTAEAEYLLDFVDPLESSFHAIDLPLLLWVDPDGNWCQSRKPFVGYAPHRDLDKAGQRWTPMGRDARRRTRSEDRTSAF